MPLSSLEQQNFSAGIFPGTARFAIPDAGLYDAVDGLLDREVGSIYRRGGSAYLSTSAFGSSGLRMLWDGFLVPGERTLFANPSDFGVLDGAEGPVNLGGAGLSTPKKAVELGGIVFIGGGAMYAGSRKTAVYNTGTVSTTNGSKTVTGSGTTWNTLVDAGMLFKISGRYYVVASVDSVTQITLRDAYEGSTASGQAYTLSPLGTSAAPYRTSDVYAVAASRLFSCEGDKAYFTEPGKPETFNAAESFHQVPGGVDIVGGAGIGSRLLLFTTAGVWVVTGLDFDLTDDAGNVQQHLDLLSPDLLLWGHEGIATYQQALVAPCADGVWLLDGVSSPKLLSGPITALYRSYVAAGHHLGLAAVDESHYLLPVLNSSNQTVDVLVCRLDLPGWTRLGAFSGDVSAFAVRTGGSASPRAPKLLAASQASSSRVLDCTGFFGPDVDRPSEPDGSVHDLDITTRDYPAKDGRGYATVKKLRVRYELKDAGSDDPSLLAYYADGAQDNTGLAVWDDAVFDTDLWVDDLAGDWVQLEGAAPEDETGRFPFPWPVNKRSRFVRFRLRSSRPAARLIIRTVELFARPSAKD